ncbi:glycosyltransferase [Lacticaseibacillus songhuajiangensis]|jgi:poly(glycerol-phosphate) alpha-glucosyltransferase|uniref:glycosyltransferase n=1 Tax=Lacticaseibacillus songhuajiangensis TaxID=1296539 RepID=UPI000F7B9C49|nr:glycosyltransferase [Lacticaseibacillus songhuajiangensis]
MYYFIGESIFTFNSGTEISQAKRARLFNDNGVPAKIVTRNYSRYLDRDRAALDVKQEELVNMYDFFQGTTAVPRQEQNLRLLKQIPKDTYHIVSHGPNYSTIELASRELARIDVLPATVGLVDKITYYDRFGNTTSRENYDWRGFKSSIDYFHPNGELAYQQFLNLAGEPVLEIAHMNINGKLSPTMWRLLNYKGHNFRFNTENQLFVFFLNELVAGDDAATLISDRRSLDAVVADVQHVQHRYAYLHELHTPDVTSIRGGRLYNFNRDLFVNRAADFDAVLVPTAKQAADIHADYPQLHVMTAPDTYVPKALQAKPVVNLRERQRHQLVYLGRLAKEKHVDELVHVLSLVRQTVPDATLELRGYYQSEELKQSLSDVISKAKLEDAVTIADYATGDKLAADYDAGAVFVQSSDSEGYGLGMFEALSHGLPVVTTNVPYGPAMQIQDGRNGFLLRPNDRQAFAARVSQLLQDDQLWQTMSSQAKASVQTHDEAKALAQWQHVLAGAATVKQ